MSATIYQAFLSSQTSNQSHLESGDALERISVARGFVIGGSDPAGVEAFEDDLTVFDIGKVVRQISVEATRCASQVREVLRLD